MESMEVHKKKARKHERCVVRDEKDCRLYGESLSDLQQKVKKQTLKRL